MTSMPLDPEKGESPAIPVGAMRPVTWDDRGIAEQSAASDQILSGAEFAALIVRHDRPLLRYIMTLIPRRDDAEEILQRTAAILWERSPEFDQRRPFLPWALRFAYFEALNFRKELARDRLVFRAEVLDAIVETRSALEGELDQRREALRKCLDAFPERDRDLLQRRYCDSATIAEMADEVGKTAKALYRRLDRIRELLADCVQRRAAGKSVSGSIKP